MPSGVGSLLGGWFSEAYGYPLSGLRYYALLAFVAGFLFPRGFWLWGMAPFVLRPAAEEALAWWVKTRGVEFVGEGAQIPHAALLVLLAVLAVGATTASALGAALRLSPRALKALREARGAASS